MQVILQGSLRHFPAAELLAFLCGRGQKGTLDLESTGRRTRILFENERLVWAESKTVPDALDAVLDVFTWDAGTFTVLDSLALPQNATPLSLTLPALHEEAKRRAESGYRDDTLFRVVENPAAHKVSLSGVQFKILFRVASGRTLRELLADLGMDREELVRQLKMLEERGLIESGAEEPVTEPQLAPPAPPPVAEPLPQNPFAADTDKIPVQEEAEVTRVERAAVDRRTLAPKTIARKPTMVGSLTPDDAPDSVYPLLDQECVIGRAPGGGITLPDGSVSAQHAKVTRTPEGFTIEDLGSRNGTFVNGEKVDKPRLLADGDVVRVGKILMTFNVAQEIKPAEKTEPEIRL